MCFLFISATLLKRDTLLTFLTSQSTTEETKALMKSVGLKFISNYPISLDGAHVAALSYVNNFIDWDQAHKLSLNDFLESFKNFELGNPKNNDDAISIFITKAHNILKASREHAGVTVVFLIDRLPVNKNVIKYFNFICDRFKVILLGVGADFDGVSLRKLLDAKVELYTSKDGTFKQLDQVPSLIYPGEVLLI